MLIRPGGFHAKKGPEPGALPAPAFTPEELHEQNGQPSEAEELTDAERNERTAKALIEQSQKALEEKRMIEERRGPERTFKGYVQREIERIDQDPDMDEATKIVKLGALDLMRSGRPSSRAQGLKLFASMQGLSPQERTEKAKKEAMDRLKGKGPRPIPKTG